MKTALVLTAALLSRAASAQPGAPLPPAPAEDPVPVAAPSESPPAPPKGDPAYGEGPDHAVVDSGPSDQAGIRMGRKIVVRYTPSRSGENITKVALLAGGSVLFGAVGLYFHYDSRSVSDEVSAHKFTGRPWTQDRQDLYDEANRSASIATVSYAIGGALLLTTAVFYMVTAPEQQTMDINPHTNAKPTALITPTRGGALVGTGWRF
jgi:hypothetical protein